METEGKLGFFEAVVLHYNPQTIEILYKAADN